MSVTIYQHANCDKCDSGFCEHVERVMSRRKREETIAEECEVVAAPLEPSRLTADDFHNSREWVEHQPQSDRECLTEDGYWLAFAEMYAAAVSKKLAELKLTLEFAELHIAELEKEIAALRETK